MNSYSIGDLSRSFQLRLNQNNLKERMNALSAELSSGIKSDISKSLGGDLSGISHITSRMTMLDTLQRNATEAGSYFGSMQTALASIQAHVEEMGPALLAEAATSSDLELRSRISAASENFRSIWNSLNTSVAGRFVFSGSNSDIAPLGDFDDMMASINSAVAGAITVDDISTRIDAWFDAPVGGGGFADQYRGNDDVGMNTPVSSNGRINNDLTANSAELRNSLKGMAMLSYAAQQGAAINTQTLRGIFSTAGTLLVKASSDLTAIRAVVGSKESMIENAKTRNAAELSDLTIARNNLIGADPLDTVSAIDEVESQIELMYALTARLSRLKLTDYL